MALLGIRDKGRVQQGQKVLINGAGGGVGMFAVQIAKSLGAEVTGVDSTMKMDFMRSIGADHVIDYTKEDYTNRGQQYDMILDVKANRSIFDYKRALRPGGIFVAVGGTWLRIFQLVFVGPLISLMGRKRFRILVLKPNKDLADLIDLIEAGKVVPVIDRRYPLDEVAEAIQYIREGRVKGKIVITLENNDTT